MTNIDDFFGENESQNVETLIGITKKFFGFVSALAEIVDELQSEHLKLSSRIDQLQRTGPAPLSASPPSPAPLSASPPSPASLSPPPPTPATPGALPEAPGLPGLPTPPSPATASAPPGSPTAPPSTPSGLPPLPGLSPAPQQPGFGQPPAPQPGFGQPPAPQPTGPAPRPSPMSLKAQMNMELKEAFARIKKGWDETD